MQVPTSTGVLQLMLRHSVISPEALVLAVQLPVTVQSVTKAFWHSVPAGLPVVQLLALAQAVTPVLQVTLGLAVKLARLAAGDAVQLATVVGPSAVVLYRHSRTGPA